MSAIKVVKIRQGISGPKGQDGADGATGPQGTPGQDAFFAGPYPSGTAALAAGLSVADPYYRTDGSAWVATGDATKLAVFGDSITNFTSVYGCIAAVGTSSNQINYNLRARVANPHLVTIAHVNPGGTAALSGSVTGTAYVISLACSGGVVTSTVADVEAFVASHWANIFWLVDFTNENPAGQLAQAQAATYFRPDCNFLTTGVWAWVQVLARQRFNFVRRLTISSDSGNPPYPEGDWDFGYDGASAAELQFNGPLADVLATDAQLIAVGAGTNDNNRGYPVATTVANVVSLVDAILAAGRAVILIEIPPSGDAGLNANAVAANTQVRAAMATRKVTTVPWVNQYVGSAAPSSDFYDGTHPSDLGAWREAEHRWPLISKFIGPTPEVRTPGDGQWLNSNPGMIGSTGGLANNWFLSTTLNTTTTKETATDGGPDWQRIVVSQPGTFNVLLITTEVVTTGFAAGDWIMGTVEIECDPNGWDMETLTLRLIVDTNGEKGIAQCLKTSFNPSVDYTPGKPFTGVMDTPKIFIGTGATSVQMSIDSVGAGSFRFRDGGPRRTTKP